MGGALGQFWYMRGHTHEGRRWLEEALVQDGPVSAAAQAKALDAVSWAAYGHGDLDRAVVAAEQGLKLITEAGVKRGIAASFLRMLGTSGRITG